jgi:sulfoxide reductase catalytic subunit YedY
MGSPIRLHLAWKYGFKSIMHEDQFCKRTPIGMWGHSGFGYGFWANVNPEVPHPRWSQAMEEVLGTGERVPTKLFNGYGEFVASLYAGLEKEPLYM